MALDPLSCSLATQRNKVAFAPETFDAGFRLGRFKPMSDDPIKNMRERVERCRRLAATITDSRAAAILTQMADEGEADIARLEAERQQRASGNE